MAVSVKLGVRPRIPFIISNSSARKPNSMACSRVASNCKVFFINNVSDTKVENILSNRRISVGV
jgi:hypothetical protein